HERSSHAYVRLTFCFSRHCKPYPATFGRRDCPCCPGTKLRFSMAHFSVKQRKPFKNSFCPSRRHRRQTASRCLANFYSPFPKLSESFLMVINIIKRGGASADGSRCAESE